MRQTKDPKIALMRLAEIAPERTTVTDIGGGMFEITASSSDGAVTETVVKNKWDALAHLADLVKHNGTRYGFMTQEQVMDRVRFEAPISANARAVAWRESALTWVGGV